MDYTSCTDLVKHQWDAIHDPGLVIGMFERDEEGMSMNLADELKASEQKGKYVELFYNLINKQVISTNELVSINGNRGYYERALIENVIISYIYVDPYDLTTYIFLPNDKKELDCIEIIGTLTKEVVVKVFPLALQSAGVATQKFEDIILKASISKISFELLKKRIGSSTKNGSALNSIRLAKLSKAAGGALGTIGKILERFGTISLWYTFLTNDMGPGEITDERIQESATHAYIRACNEISIPKNQ